MIRTGEICNAACEDLQKLREKKAAIENEALVESFMKRDKTLEEAIFFCYRWSKERIGRSSKEASSSTQQEKKNDR